MLNKVTLIGNLGADPDVRYMPTGGAVANITLATTFRWKDKQSGERKEKTEWHRVVFFSRLAEIVGEYLRKGSQVYIEGRLQTRKWQDQKSGQDRYTTEIVATEMSMLGSRSGGTAPLESSPDSNANAPVNPQDNATPDISQATQDSPPAAYEDFDDDIPF